MDDARHAARRSARAHALELLEQRRLPTVTLAGSTLTITGTATSDTYDLTKSGSNLSVVENGGAAQLFPLANVTAIVASLGAAADRFTSDDLVLIPTSLNGEVGNDTLIGGGGDDTIVGGAGNDTCAGGDGDDSLVSDAGADSLMGQAGFDIASFAPRAGKVEGQLGVILDRGGSAGAYTYDFRGVGFVTAGSDRIDFDDVNSVIGSAGDDKLSLGELNSPYWNDVTSPRPQFGLAGGNGKDRLLANAGFVDSTTLAQQTVPVLLSGDAGDDNLIGDVDPHATLSGGEGNDMFTFTNSNYERAHELYAYVDAGNGHDTLNIGRTTAVDYTIPPGLEKFIAYSNSDLNITGNAEPNKMTLIAGGSVRVDAGDGDDVITIDTQYYHPETTNRTVTDLGDGNDSLFITGGTDTVRGGTGDDTITAGTGDDHVWGGDGDDRIHGGGNKDILRGGTGDDSIHGNGGGDHLYGGDGSDRLNGGTGTNYLDGEGGRDVLEASGGIDTAKRSKKDRLYVNIALFV